MDVTTQLELCLHKHTQILHVANAALEWVATYVHSYTVVRFPYFLNQAHGLWPCASGLLKLLWLARRYVCVCVSALQAINNQWHDMV